MTTITIKKLKELLDQFPEEALIYISDDNNYGETFRDITSVVIEYVGNDDYQLPEIILK